MKFLEVTCTFIRLQTRKSFMKKHAERYPFPSFSTFLRLLFLFICSNLFSSDVIRLKLFIYTTV